MHRQFRVHIILLHVKYRYPHHLRYSSNMYYLYIHWKSILWYYKFCFFFHIDDVCLLLYTPIHFELYPRHYEKYVIEILDSVMFLWKVLMFLTLFLVHAWLRDQRFSQSLERIWGFPSLILSFLGFLFHFPAVWIALNSDFWFFKPVRYCLLLALFTPTSHKWEPTIRLKAINKRGGGVGITWNFSVSMIHGSILFQNFQAFVHSLVPSCNCFSLNMFCPKFIVYIFIRIDSIDATWPNLNSLNSIGLIFILMSRWLGWVGMGDNLKFY